MIKIDLDNDEQVDYICDYFKNETLKNEIEEKDKEIDRLNNIINDLNYYIKQRTEENITDELRIELKNIELISKGIIKVVKGE